jgi:hypothetical protein
MKTTLGKSLSSEMRILMMQGQMSLYFSTNMNVHILMVTINYLKLKLN